MTRKRQIVALVAVIASVLGVYVASYFALVTRGVCVGFNNVSTYGPWYRVCPQIAHTLFLPVHRLDARFIRPGHWRVVGPPIRLTEQELGQLGFDWESAPGAGNDIIKSPKQSRDPVPHTPNPTPGE